jgi:hypothetical protein
MIEAAGIAQSILYELLYEKVRRVEIYKMEWNAHMSF